MLNGLDAANVTWRVVYVACGLRTQAGAPKRIPPITQQIPKNAKHIKLWNTRSVLGGSSHNRVKDAAVANRSMLITTITQSLWRSYGFVRLTIVNGIENWRTLPKLPKLASIGPARASPG
jgi:hypothetical protein